MDPKSFAKFASEHVATNQQLWLYHSKIHEQYHTFDPRVYPMGRAYRIVHRRLDEMHWICVVLYSTRYTFAYAKCHQTGCTKLSKKANKVIAFTNDVVSRAIRENCECQLTQFKRIDACLRDAPVVFLSGVQLPVIMADDIS